MMNNLSPSNNESKNNDAPNLCIARQQLRFTSINSINRKITKPENVLKFAQKTIETILETSDVFLDAFKYEFDIFEFINHTNRPLLVLGIYLLSNSSIFTKLFNKNQVDLLQCAHFLDLCEKLYQNNPYHNHIHATDVMQFNTILLSSVYIQHNLHDYECLAAFMAAAAHDIGHIGKNNDFLIKSKHNLAIRYNKISCLENYHIEQFHQTITDNSKANWTKYFSPKKQKYIIEIVEYAIIGTDMGVYHDSIKQELKERYTSEYVYKQAQLSFEEKKFIIRTMLHLSDISNPMRLFNISRKWAKRVNEEFFSQGDVMKEMGLDISYGCDRDKTDLVKNQCGFVNFCVKPLTQSLTVMISELDWCLKNIEINDEKWKKLNINQENGKKSPSASTATVTTTPSSTNEKNLSGDF